jgi:hypothetical protein
VQLAFSGDDAQLAEVLGGEPAQPSTARTDSQIGHELSPGQYFGEPQKADTTCGDYEAYYPPDRPPLSLTPPCYKRSSVGQAEWRNAGDAFNGLPDAGLNEAVFYSEFFAAEGGQRRIEWEDRNRRDRVTAGGVLDDTLNAARNSGKVLSIAGVMDPGDLDPVQRADVYRYLLDDTLRWAMPDRKDGHKALSQIASPYTAAAVADPLFRYPGPDGTRLVQTAVDQAIGGLPDDVRQRHRDLFANHRVDGKFGQETMNAIVALEQEGFGPHLREAIANLRYHKPEEEAWRYEHFRFRGKP